jgi:hypothetical protein
MAESDDTPVTYTPEEMSRIKTMMAMSHGQVLCPRCGKPMRILNPVATVRGRVFQVRCKPCRCTAVIRDDPGS